MPGAERLRDSQVLEKMTREQRDQGRLYAAICATPAVFFEVRMACWVGDQVPGWGDMNGLVGCEI